MRLLGLLALLVATLPAPAHAWDRDGHFAWTYYVALHAGFTERQALQIASGAQAVDADPFTQPPEAVAWERFATDDGALTDPGLRTLLRDLHCFAPTPDGPADDALAALGWVPLGGPEAAAAIAARGDALAEQAARTENPGVLVHYVQDCAAHRGFGDRRGHAGAGHLPDWLATDLGRATEMTLRTVGALATFQASQGIEPADVDVDRLLDVLEQITEASPVDLSGTIGPEGPANPLRWLEVELGETALEAVFERRRALQLQLGERFDLGRPSLGTAVTTIAMAIREDKVLGRLPAFPHEWWSIPFHTWLPYRLDRDGAPQPGSPPWALESIHLEIALDEVAVHVDAPRKRADDRLYAITITLPYRVRGVADLPPWRGVPVRTACTLGDEPPAVHFADHVDGEYVMRRVFHRAAAELTAPIPFACTAQVHGTRPATVQASVPALPASLLAAERPAERDVPGATSEPLAALRAVRDEALGLAGSVTSAAEVARAHREEASDRVALDRPLIRGADRALTAAEAGARDVPTARRDARRALVQATDARDHAATTKARLDTAHVEACAQADTLARSRDLEVIRAAWQLIEATDGRARTEHDALTSALATLASRHDEVVGLEARMSELEAEGRRLKDAIGAIEPSLRGAERALDAAGGQLRRVGPDAARLAALEREAARLAADVRAAWEADGKPREGRPALKDAALLLAQAAAASRRGNAALERESVALTAAREQARGAASAAAELGARVALLADRLPPPALLSDLASLSLDARDVTASARRFGPEGALVLDRARTCRHAAEALHTAHTSPAGQKALLDCSSQPGTTPTWDRRAGRATCAE